jgi:hypothetical protein
MKTGLRNLPRELLSHLPFSIFSAVGGMALVAILTFLAAPFYEQADAPHAAHHEEHAAPAEGETEAEADPSAHHEHDHGHGLPGAMRDLFHIFHPAHMLFSATATTAMFWRYERRLLKACIVGFLGAVIVCGISDILIPYLSGLLLGAEMAVHICILKHPGLVLPFTLVGIVAGVLSAEHIGRATFFSHTAHVVTSSTASLLYLVSFGLTDWIDVAGLVFVFVILAVMIPCCASDIVFPLLAVTREGDPPPTHAHAH